MTCNKFSKNTRTLPVWIIICGSGGFVGTGGQVETTEESKVLAGSIMPPIYLNTYLATTGRYFRQSRT